MHFLCTVRCWVHQGCWPRLLHSGLSPSFCSVLFSFSPISTSYMTGSIRKFVPGKIQYYWNSSGLDLLSPEQHLFVFLSYRRLSKEVLTCGVGDTVICHVILWPVLQKSLLFSVNFPAHCQWSSDNRLACKLSQTLGTLTNSNWLCNRSRQHVQC